MAFEQVTLRTADGQTYGPIALQEMVQWYREGRVAADAVLIDAVSGEERPVAAFPAFTLPPPPLPGVAGAIPAPMRPQPTDVFFRTPNKAANTALILGLLSAFGCFVVAPFALGYGLSGLRTSQETGEGRVQSLIGIVTGILGILLVIGLVVQILVEFAQ